MDKEVVQKIHPDWSWEKVEESLPEEQIIRLLDGPYEGVPVGVEISLEKDKPEELYQLNVFVGESHDPGFHDRLNRLAPVLYIVVENDELEAVTNDRPTDKYFAEYWLDGKGYSFQEMGGVEK